MRKFAATIVSIIISISMPNLSMASSYNVNNLIVHIRNIGAENCLLSSLKIFQGLVAFGDIPRWLNATGENYSFVMQGQTINMTMSYQCGRYKGFSISMINRYSSNIGQAQVETKFYDAVNVFERRTIEPGFKSCPEFQTCTSVPSRINWEISN